MSKIKQMLKKRIALWLVFLMILLIAAAAVYAVAPAISLNSATSFPVDI